MAVTANVVLRLNPEKQTVDNIPVSMPTISDPDDIIVKVIYAGVCGTDLHIMAGMFPGSPKDLILGHEISGVVHETGSDVLTLSVGMRVVINPMTSCGKCSHCRRGNVELCREGSIFTECGIFRDGGWRKFWKVRCNQVEPLPDDIPLPLAVLAEPLACVYQGWSRNGPVETSDTILIMGSGIIGLLWAALFHSRGYLNVFVSELNPQRQSLVLGIAPVYNVVTPEYLANKEEIFDLIIDCTGSTKAIESGFTLLKRKGRMNIFGCSGSEEIVSFRPIEFLLKNLTLISTLISPHSLPKSIHILTELYQKGYLDVGQLGMRIYNVEEKNRAIEDLRAGHITKALLKME